MTDVLLFAGGLFALLVVLPILYGVQPTTRHRHRDPSPERLMRCRLSLHAWRLAKDTRITRYYACRDCQERRVNRCVSGLAQPVDLGWVQTGSWTIRRPPRPNSTTGTSTGRRP